MEGAALRVAAAAMAAGVLWGLLAAALAWRWEGAEIVLLQGWILFAAWAFGRAARTPRAGALAGLAVVGAAIYVYELLPAWGLEARLESEGVPFGELQVVVAGFDAEDVALFSTLVIGALVGLGGGIRRRPEPDTAPVPAQPAAPEPIREPPPPRSLWAGDDAAIAPPEPVPVVVTAAQPAPAPASPAPRPAAARAHPAAATLLVAGLATDFVLDRAFGLYTEPQFAVAVGFLVAGLAAAAWLGRRHAVTVAVAGAAVALVFAAVQNAEYDERRDQIVIAGGRPAG